MEINIFQKKCPFNPEKGNSTLEGLSLFSKVILGLTTILLASQILVILSK